MFSGRFLDRCDAGSHTSWRGWVASSISVLWSRGASTARPIYTLWSKFTTVVILTKQVWAAGDLTLPWLLTRIW